MHLITVINNKIGQKKEKKVILREIMGEYRLDKTAAEYAYNLAIGDKNVNVK